MCNQVRARCRWPTMLESNRRKKRKKPLRGYLCPLTTGGLISVRRCLDVTCLVVGVSSMGHGDDRLSLPCFLSLTLSPQLLQQRLGLLEVSGIKALGEPAIDRRQQGVGFGP